MRIEHEFSYTDFGPRLVEHANKSEARHASGHPRLRLVMPVLQSHRARQLGLWRARRAATALQAACRGRLQRSTYNVACVAARERARQQTNVAQLRHKREQLRSHRIACAVRLQSRMRGWFARVWVLLAPPAPAVLEVQQQTSSPSASSLVPKQAHRHRRKDTCILHWPTVGRAVR